MFWWNKKKGNYNEKIKMGRKHPITLKETIDEKLQGFYDIGYLETEKLINKKPIEFKAEMNLGTCMTDNFPQRYWKQGDEMLLMKLSK